MKERENIKIEGHIGTWHIIRDFYYQGQYLYLLEHETYGDEAAMLWVDGKKNIIIDEVFNGIEDLYEYIEENK